MKLIIDIPKSEYMETKRYYDNLPEYSTVEAETYYIAHGIPLDDVRAEIVKAYEDATIYSCDEELSRFASRVCGIIGKAGSEDKK